ncbi:MAG TPA: preprotein translocase subunit SecE [Gemmataceae bacterium]|nr:preprotein translocase subunit SecE [Gemmataceae bacterium]
MATTAVETSSEPKAPKTSASLFAASLIGAVYVVAALAVVFYAVPQLWAQYVAPQLGGYSFVNLALRLVVQLAAAVGLIVFGQSLAGANPPKGLRGGIFWVIAFACAIFFIGRSIGLSLETSSIGLPLTLGFVALMVFLALRMLTGERGHRRMIRLEEAGWLHTSTYQGALGLKVRRLTILGILLVIGSGVYSLMYQGILPESWAIKIPFTDTTVTLLPDAKYTVPLLLMGLGLWFAWRMVNVPSFGEFLIATEAEMNKVSWSSRKQLTQDTIVVLITTILMALFLLVVDVFWGWLLSRQTIGVLPGKATNQGKGDKIQEAKW